MPLVNEPVDGPYPYDVTINGSGYVLARGIEPSLPFRTQRAKYAYTPTFIERQNTSGNFGDNQQDFWLTAAQNDWSLGEGQNYFDPNDTEKSRKYLIGEGVTPLIPGQVRLRYDMVSLTGASASIATGVASDTQFYAFTLTALYQVLPNTFPSPDTLASVAAHGLGVAPTCAAFDGDNLYFSSASASTVRRYNIAGASFASFSAASPADSLLYLNNTLYGTKGGVFYTYASTGVATASFTFKDAVGTTLSSYSSKLIGVGGKVFVLRSGPVFPTLWQWDGSGMSKLAEFPNNFNATDLCVVDGIVFVIGLEFQAYSQFGTGALTRPAIWFYSGSSIGRTWVGSTLSNVTIYPAITAFGDGFAFTDSVSQTMRYYDLTEGAVATLCPASTFSGSSFFADSNVMSMDGNHLSFFVWNPANSNVFEFKGDPSSGFITTSQIDFDSSLEKLIRGITVLFNTETGGTPVVDIAYALDGSTTFTTLQASATSGVEYQLPSNTQANTISVKVTLHVGGHSGSSFASPILRRIYVRAAPVITQFRTSEYIFDLSATQGKTPVVLNNGQPHPKTGRAQLDTLLADITTTTPFTVVDRLGTYTAVADLANMEILELRQEQFYVRLPVRQV